MPQNAEWRNAVSNSAGTEDDNRDIEPFGKHGTMRSGQNEWWAKCLNAGAEHPEIKGAQVWRVPYKDWAGNSKDLKRML